MTPTAPQSKNLSPGGLDHPRHQRSALTPHFAGGPDPPARALAN